MQVPVLVSDLDLECQMWIKIGLAPVCPWIGESIHILLKTLRSSLLVMCHCKPPKPSAAFAVYVRVCVFVHLCV
jgi:hypothetical protein